MNHQKYFQNKKITKQGFGVLGRSLGTVKFLLKNNVEVLITDTKPEENFIEQIAELKLWMTENKIPKDRVQFVFGEHRISDFQNCDLVISANGVPKDNLNLKSAKEKNIPVYQESSLFLKIIQDFNKDLSAENKIKIICITGTRGKTTTTHLIFKILKDFYNDRNVFLGGNVQGISTIELLEKIGKKDIVVMETDSWLVQGYEAINFAPDFTVFTNFMRDHMNYYKGNMKEYFTDKAQTFLYQKENSTLVATEDFKNYISEFLNQEYLNLYEKSKNKKIFLTKNDVENDKKIFKSPLQGEHNRFNISLAVKVAQELKIDENSIKKSVENFSGVSGRLEFVKEIDGVKFYNDTTATTPDATMVALNTLQENNDKIILICGGTDKELSIELFAERLIADRENNKIKQIILLKDATTSGTKKLLEKFEEKKFHKYEVAVNLNEAFLHAKQIAEIGDAVLFSPAFASFGMFKNEYHRGEMFLELINLKLVI